VAKKNEVPGMGAESDAAAGSMGQIREILFGQLEREIHSRLQKIEQLIGRNAKDSSEQLAEARGELDQQLSDLAESTTASVDKIIGELSASRAEAQRDVEELSKELTASIQRAEKQFENELKTARDRLQKNVDALSGNLERSVEQLEAAKADRADLGDMLIEIGMRLKGDATLEAIKAQVNKAQNANVVKQK